MIRNWLKNIGPGPLIAAAFIGPGTVTVCTLAGVGFGFSLLWAMVLSIVATIVLQEMAARLGIITQKGLSEVIRTEINNPFIRTIVVILILSAIVIGNAAYEAGNISGAILGMESFITNPYIDIGNNSVNYLSILIGIIAFGLLFIGNYKVIEKSLIGLVTLMSLAFVITAILTKPNLAEIIKGAFTPNFSSNNLITIIALIGTTVVPYNLFLHAALVKEKWSKNDLGIARKDTYVAIVLGGLVSMAIIISAAAIQSLEIENAAGLAKGLEPLFGSFAKYFIGIGLFAAGITSAITAPLAAAYVVKGCLGWDTTLKSTRFRMVWIVILFTGVIFSSLGFKPIDIIKFAQVANGLLLPIMAGLLIWIMNKETILGKHKNNLVNNILGCIIFGITLMLSIATLNKIFDLNLF
ncbi:MAG: Nramp family divalent metal transporter [Bacteroidia bacterium]|nr:Nramp family divalent metal transporter [Bacteroidia bacterium]NND09949.1 Nramp family divalent metal transporter [Flavobacteriaceae bacterium]NNK27500.1 Nramp family divalent metal transporter [Flavobacteriaceae bacterium]